MIKFLKIPNNCYSHSKTQGLLNDVAFYYELKAIGCNGFFKKGTLNTLHQSLRYKQPTIWKKLKRLADNNLIRKYSNGYQLISYDELFATLKYDMTVNNGRKGSFKIHKIPLSDCSDIKDLLAWIDIRENLTSQTHNAIRNLKKSSQYTAKDLSCTTLNDKRKLLQSIVDKNTVHMVKSNDDNEEHCQMIESFMIDNTKSHCNPDVTLSLEGICSVLLLPNPSSAHNIIRRLQHQKRVTVENRELFIESTCLSYKQVKEKFGDSYTFRDGMIFRTLSNLITCINN